MLKTFRKLFIATLAFCWIFPAGIVYSGTIKGSVTYSGKIAVPPAHKTGKYKKACGPEVANETVVMDKNGLKNAVISISGKGLQGKPREYVMDQKNCRYEPHVVAMPKGSTLEIRSSDPFNHNIHTYSFDNDPINLMFTPGQTVNQRFDEPEIIKVECDLHSWMSSWIHVAENELFALSKEGGTFEIPNVPPGSYTLNAWHEVLGSTKQAVKVGDGVTEVNFDFSQIAPQVSKK